MEALDKNIMKLDHCVYCAHCVETEAGPAPASLFPGYGPRGGKSFIIRV